MVFVDLYTEILHGILEIVMHLHPGCLKKNNL